VLQATRAKSGAPAGNKQFITQRRMNNITLHVYLSMHLVHYKYTDNNERNV